MKKVGELSEREQVAFDRFRVCKAAVDQVVHSAIREWETALLAEGMVWKEIARRCELDLATHTYTAIGSAIMEIEPTDPDRRDESAAKWVSQMLRKQGD